MAKKRKLDRRIRRTRRQLQLALFDLIQQMPYEDITVSEIVKTADISRATFYLHYDHKDKLLLDSIYALIVDALETSADTVTDLRSIAHSLFLHVEAHSDVYKALQNNKLTTFIIQNQVNPLVERIRTHIKHARPADKYSEMMIDMVAHQLAGSLYALVLWWLTNDMPHPPVHMAQYFHDLTIRGFQRNLNLPSKSPTN